MKKNYSTIVEIGRDSIPYREEATTSKVLAPGAYTWEWNNQIKEGKFIQFKPNCDEIIDLPSDEYTRVVSELEFFLNPETKKKFQQTGFLYKRSALLYGAPGTGKTMIVQRVMREVITRGGIVLFINDPRTLKYAYNVLDDLQPDTTVLTIFEEIDSLIDYYEDSAFLSILDGEIQKNNVMYLATTNYIEKIPGRLLRPGRFSSVIEVKYPNAEARRAYFKLKLGTFTDLDMWVEKTENLSVDELKEVVQSVYIFNNDLDETVERILQTKGMSAIRSEKQKQGIMSIFGELKERNPDLYEELEEEFLEAQND